MEALIFIGIQASGKSTFYSEQFFNSHVRVSNDLLKTKNREAKLIDFCLATQMPFVIDNTNVTKAVRANYISKIKTKNFKIVGYYFSADISRSLEWNLKRFGKAVIPQVGILGTYKKLEIPQLNEGFDQLFYVTVIDDKFIVKEWDCEI